MQTGDFYFGTFGENSSGTHTPELFGRVIQISPDSFVDELTQATYYRAEIQLPEEELDRLPEGLVMVPGMPVEAFIATDARTPMAYLLRPLTDYFARAFRES
jgi:HlyD family secretion protein